MVGERANRLEAQCHSDRCGVDAAGVWEESHAPYPERSVVLPMATSVARRTEGTAEVSRGHSSRGLAARSIETLARKGRNGRGSQGRTAMPKGRTD